MMKLHMFKSTIQSKLAMNLKKGGNAHRLSKEDMRKHTRHNR